MLTVNPKYELRSLFEDGWMKIIFGVGDKLKASTADPIQSQRASVVNTNNIVGTPNSFLRLQQNELLIRNVLIEDIF